MKVPLADKHGVVRAAVLQINTTEDVERNESTALDKVERRGLVALHVLGGVYLQHGGADHPMLVCERNLHPLSLLRASGKRVCPGLPLPRPDSARGRMAESATAQSRRRAKTYRAPPALRLRRPASPARDRARAR